MLFLVLTYFSCDLMLFSRCLYEALKESRKKRPGVKKTVSKKNKSSKTSAAMPPGRVMAPAPGQKKRILEPDEPALDRVTRQKARMATATDHQESMLRMDSQTLVQTGDELPPMDEGTTLSMDGSGTICIDEAGTVHTDLSPVAPSIDRNAVINEEEQQLVLQSGKLTFAMLSFTSAFSKWNDHVCFCRFLHLSISILIYEFRFIFRCNDSQD